MWPEFTCHTHRSISMDFAKSFSDSKMKQVNSTFKTIIIIMCGMEYIKVGHGKTLFDFVSFLAVQAFFYILRLHNQFLHKT